MNAPRCYCHDPAVFGHQERCALGLGPREAGGHGRGVDGLGPPIAGIDYSAHYADRLMAAAAWWGDARFFGATVAASFGAGWLWSLAEWLMRVDLHV